MRVHLFIDPRSVATRPAEVPVRWLLYLRRHPQALVWAIAAGTAAGGIGWIIQARTGWACAGIGLALSLLLHFRYLRARFAGGMLYPAVVLSENPFFVAALTDLASTPQTTYPARF